MSPSKMIVERLIRHFRAREYSDSCNTKIPPSLSEPSARPPPTRSGLTAGPVSPRLASERQRAWGRRAAEPGRAAERRDRGERATRSRAEYLGVGAPGQLGLDDHDHDAEHAEDQRVVAEALALLEQSPAVPQLVADVLVLLLGGLGPAVVGAARAGAGAGGAVERQVVGVVVLGLGDHDLRAGGVGAGERRLQRLRLSVHLVQVPAGRAQVAERPHDAAVVPAAAHGYFGEGIALPALLGLLGLLLLLVVGAAAAAAAAGARCLLQAVALVVWSVLGRLPRCASMTGGGQLADIQLAALPGGGDRGERRGAGAEGARERRGGAEQQRQVIPGGRRRRSPVVGAVVALEARALLLLLLLEEETRLVLLLPAVRRRRRALLLLLGAEARREVPRRLHTRAVKAAGGPDGGAPCAMRYGR